MYISRIDLLNQSFSKVMRGYSPAEVDAVIKEAATAIGALGEERSALEVRVAELEGQLGEYRNRESTLRDTLMTTQRVTDDLKSAAQKEAQLIIEAARAKADSLLNQCNQRLARLQDEIATAHRVRAQVYMQVRASLEQHLTLLNMTFAEGDANLDADAAKFRAAHQQLLEDLPAPSASAENSADPAKTTVVRRRRTN